MYFSGLTGMSLCTTQFEVEMRPCAERSAVSHQCDGFASFHAVAFFFSSEPQCLVDRDEILIVLYAYHVTGFSGRLTQERRCRP